MTPKPLPKFLAEGFLHALNIFCRAIFYLLQKEK